MTLQYNKFFSVINPTLIVYYEYHTNTKLKLNYDFFSASINSVGTRGHYVCWRQTRLPNMVTS